MSAFPDWKKYVVPQRRPESGCIPTGYEILLRAVGVEGIDYAAFQDDFDLDKDRSDNELPRNNFQSVSELIQRKYPHVQFTIKNFPDDAGNEKVAFIEHSLNNKRLVLIALNMAVFGYRSWHIMPVVDMDEATFLLVNVVKPNGTIEVLKIAKDIIAHAHNELSGGKDIAYLSETISAA